jgi:sorbitol-6-phosphate 2-dehydrogenase
LGHKEYDMDKGSIAALLRGLCIDLTGRPHMVMLDTRFRESTPSGALHVAISAQDDEKAVAGIILAAYASWKAGIAPANDGGVPIPACAAVEHDGVVSVFWTGSSLDSARKRLANTDASPRFTPKTAPGTTIRPEERADVVKGRIVLVTGGAQGIGEEIVRNLAKAGALVFIADLNLEGAHALAEAVNAEEKRTAALAVKANVSDEASVRALFASVAEASGGLDLCVSNAGVLKAASVLEQELDDFKLVTDINYTGFFLIAKYAGRLLRTQHLAAPLWKTDIVQINSKSGLEGSNKNGAYAGGKFGGIGLVSSFALELVAYNVKVNAVCPGNFLDGPLWSHPEKGLFVQYLQTGKVPGAQTVADVRAFYESKVPMKRGCTGKDLVRAIYYIVEQEYETGQAIPVTGGQVMLH